MKSSWSKAGYFTAGLMLVPVLVLAYLRWDAPPVSVSDHPFPLEATIVQAPMSARIARDLVAQPPFPQAPEALIAGAEIYKENCMVCHGAPNNSSKIGKHMYPSAPQLWVAHRPGVVGVSDDPAGETYWKVKNGIRLTGMPSYEAILTDRQMWQVTMLLASAATNLSSEVEKELRTR